MDWILSLTSQGYNFQIVFEFVDENLFTGVKNNPTHCMAELLL